MKFYIPFVQVVYTMAPQNLSKPAKNSFFGASKKAKYIMKPENIFVCTVFGERNTIFFSSTDQPFGKGRMLFLARYSGNGVF